MILLKNYDNYVGIRLHLPTSMLRGQTIQYVLVVLCRLFQHKGPQSSQILDGNK